MADSTSKDAPIGSVVEEPRTKNTPVPTNRISDVAAEHVPGKQDIPVPDTTEVGKQVPDTNNDIYVDKKLSKKEKERLKKTATCFTDHVGMIGEVYAPWSVASEFMRHFKGGTGTTKTISPDNVQDVERNTALSSVDPAGRKPVNTIAEKFINEIRRDMEHYNGPPRAYLSKNVTRGNHWFAARAETDKGDDQKKWYYALGGFAISYGALATPEKDVIRIDYKLFLWDRYNWKPGQGITNPYPKWWPTDCGITKLGDLKTPAFNYNGKTFPPSPYYNAKKNKIDDALQGAMQPLAGAKPFDVWGEGVTRRVYFKRALTYGPNGQGQPATEPIPAPGAGSAEMPWR